MKFFTSAVVALAASVTALDYQNMDCVDGVHLITLGGEYTTVGNLSLLLTLAQSILSAIPNSAMYQIGYTQDAIAQTDIAQGIPAFRDHFTQYVAKCPNTKVVTAGYSVGASILMDVFCGAPTTGIGALTPTTLRENLLANVIYGDLTYLSTQRCATNQKTGEHVGTCTDGEGIVPRQYPGHCYPFGRKTRSWCDVNDPQCCTRGGDPNIHFTYPAIYDGDATDFVLAKWHYWKANPQGGDDN